MIPVAARIAAMAKEPGEHMISTGFFLRVSPKLKAVWVYKFRDRDGAQVNGKLGTVLESGALDGLSGTEAEKKFTKIWLKEKSPVGTVFPAEPGPVVDTFTLDAAFAAIKKDTLLAPPTLENYCDIYRRHLSDFGPRPLASITVPEWREKLRDIKSRTPHGARAIYWLTSKIYETAVESELATKNILKSKMMRNEFVSAAAAAKRTSMLQPGELRPFWDALQAVPNRGHGRAVIGLLFVTGWRLDAAQQLKWEQLNLVERTLTPGPQAPGWKRYESVVHLSMHVTNILLARRETAGQPSKGFVFPGPAGVGHIKNSYGTIARASEPLGWVVKPHDLRRTAATVASVVFGGDLARVAALIGHEGGAAPGLAQTHDYVRHLRTAALEDADALATALLGLAGAIELPLGLAEKLATRGWVAKLP